MVATIDCRSRMVQELKTGKRFKEKWERECVFTLTFLLFPFPFTIPL